MANLNIRIDETLKKDVDYILSKLGLSTSEAVRMFFAQIKNCRGIPFEVRLASEEERWIKKAVADTEEDIKAGRISKPYSDVTELMNDLLKD